MEYCLKMSIKPTFGIILKNEMNSNDDKIEIFEQFL